MTARANIKKAIGAAAGVVVGAAVPLASSATGGVAGLTFEALVALGILAGAIVWWVAGTLPEYATALVMAVLFIVVAGVPTDVVFSTFSTSTWWLLVAAFGLGLGMRKSGLMRRMALAVLRVFPRTFRAQAAGLVAAGTLVGPLIPSLSAKASILAPLSLSISDSLGYERRGREATGLFLAMFTGLRNIGPAVISASIIGYGLLGVLPDDVRQQFDMLHWFLGMLPWFAVVTILNYGAIVALFGPRAERHGKGKKAKGEGSKAAFAEEPPKSSASVSPSGDSDDAIPDLGPMSRDEKRMCAIIACCVVLWVAEPLHHVASHVVALAAFVAVVACGIFDKSDLRSGIAWDSLLFIGVVLGLASVFAYLGIDTWVVGLCQPMFSSLAENPYLFVAGVGLVTLALRFVIVSEMAYVNLFMAFMVPLAVSLGINPWVVGVAVYAMLNPWFAPYQNSIYFTAYYATDGEMAQHSACAAYCVLYQAICLLALMVSVPYWQLMGLL